MNYLCNIDEKVSPSIIRAISDQIGRMHSIGLGQNFSRNGIPIPDDQGIAILAEDKGDQPLVFCFGIPVPLTEGDGREFLSLWENACKQVGIDNTKLDNVLFSCFELLNELITNELAVSNITKISITFSFNTFSKL